jgi:predicted methyltransferase
MAEKLSKKSSYETLGMNEIDQELISILEKANRLINQQDLDFAIDYRNKFSQDIKKAFDVSEK